MPWYTRSCAGHLTWPRRCWVPELMSFSMYDHQVQLRRFLDEVTETFVEVLRQQAARIPAVEGGLRQPVWHLGAGHGGTHAV